MAVLFLFFKGIFMITELTYTPSNSVCCSLFLISLPKLSSFSWMLGLLQLVWGKILGGWPETRVTEAGMVGILFLRPVARSDTDFTYHAPD
jgi:hypothetical protein